MPKVEPVLDALIVAQYGLQPRNLEFLNAVQVAKPGTGTIKHSYSALHTCNAVAAKARQQALHGHSSCSVDSATERPALLSVALKHCFEEGIEVKCLH